MAFRKRKAPITALVVAPEQSFIRLLGSAIDSSSNPDKVYLSGALRARRLDLLLDWADRPSPQMYDSSSSYFEDCQLAAMIRKYPFSDGAIPGLNPEATAVKKFLAAEHRCKRYNQVYRSKLRFEGLDQRVFTDLARRYIVNIIGRTPIYQDIFDCCDLTAGASMGVHGDKTNVQRKIFAESWTATPSALPYVIPALWNNIQIRDCILPGAIKCYDKQAFSHIVRDKVLLVDHNMITFVPKTARTHRAIAVEPLLNGFLQKGIDGHLRKLLKGAGIDLSDQHTNQLLARSGSMDGFNPYATVDLAAASDSLSIEVVRSLVPPDWFEFLSDIRAPRFLMKGDVTSRRYEKFCSMGNGFCFPLQSLVFASFCYAASKMAGGDPWDFSVYGDDLVIRQNAALLLIERLQGIGFKTNVDKTFVTGPFRESCGADWYSGQDVRPVHFDKQLVDERQLFALHNSFLRSPRMESWSVQIRSTLRAMSNLKLLRPGREPGDTAFSVPLDVAMSSSLVRWDPERFNWRWRELATKAVADPGKLGEVEHANALMLAAMRGAKSHMPFPLRYQTTCQFRTVRRLYYNTYRSEIVERPLQIMGETVQRVSDLRKLVRLSNKVHPQN